MAEDQDEVVEFLGECVCTQLEIVVQAVFRRVDVSVVKHGDWSDYDAQTIFDKVMDEADEYREAVAAGVVSGKHGQIDELIDVAVTAIKGVRRLVELEGNCDG